MALRCSSGVRTHCHARLAFGATRVCATSAPARRTRSVACSSKADAKNTGPSMASGGAPSKRAAARPAKLCNATAMRAMRCSSWCACWCGLKVAWPRVRCAVRLRVLRRRGATALPTHPCVTLPGDLAQQGLAGRGRVKLACSGELWLLGASVMHVVVCVVCLLCGHWSDCVHVARGPKVIANAAWGRAWAMPRRPVVRDPRNARRSMNRNRAAYAHQRRAHHQRRAKGLKWTVSTPLGHTV